MMLSYEQPTWFNVHDYSLFHMHALIHTQLFTLTHSHALIHTLNHTAPRGNITQRNYDLIVGILSARHNRQLRDAQRETWVGFVKTNAELRERWCSCVVELLVWWGWL